MRPLKKIIDLEALRWNLNLFKNKIKNSENTNKKIIGVVKANAYGHDVLSLKKVLNEELNDLAVASIEEALFLRQNNFHQTIYLLEGFFEVNELEIIKENRFIPIIHSHWQFKALQNKNIPFYIKVDTGMHRLGFPPEEALFYLNQANNLGWVSHFACADENNDQMDIQWNKVAHLKDYPYILSNSAGFLKKDFNEQAVRIGLALYGIQPYEEALPQLKPIMTLRTEIIAIRQLKTNDCAGYGGQFIAPENGYLATIALGYGDGFPRAIPNGKVHLLLNNKRYPIVGRVSMDMILLWLGKDKAQIGDEVIVFGQNNPIELVAEEAQTIPYTLSTMLTQRVPTLIKE